MSEEREQCDPVRKSPRKPPIVTAALQKLPAVPQLSARDAAMQLKSVPRPPQLRNECIFFSEAYNHFVRGRRVQMMKADFDRRVQQLQSGRFDDLSSGEGRSDLELVGDTLRRWQKQWLVNVQLVAFLMARTLARRHAALLTLRRMLLPCILRKRGKYLKARRQNLAASLVGSQMTPVTIETLRKLEAFERWDEDVLEDMCKAFVAAVMPPNAWITHERSLGDLHILDRGEVHVCKHVPPSAEVLVAAFAAKKRGSVAASSISKLLQDSNEVLETIRTSGTALGLLSVMDGEPAYVAYRVGDSACALLWTLPRKTYIEAKAKCQGSTPELTRTAVARLRCLQSRLALQPNPQALRNCMLNVTFSPWSDRQLSELVHRLHPHAFFPGDVIYDSADTDKGNRFVLVARGVAEITLHAAGLQESPSSSLNGSASFALSSAQRTVRSVVGAWTTVGEMSVAIPNEKRHVSMVAKSNVDVWMCGKDALSELLRNDPLVLAESRKSICLQRAKEMMTSDQRQAHVQMIAECLKKDPVMKLLPATSFLDLAQQASPLWFPPNDLVYGAKNQPTRILIVVSGAVRVSAARQRSQLGYSQSASPAVSLSSSMQSEVPGAWLRMLGPGTVFGAALAVLEEPWTYGCSVLARSVVEAYEIGFDLLQSAVERHTRKENAAKKLHDAATTAFLNQQLEPFFSVPQYSFPGA